jgi:hypothetical protein
MGWQADRMTQPLGFHVSEAWPAWATPEIPRQAMEFSLSLRMLILGAYVEPSPASQLFEATTYRGSASGPYDVAIRVSRYSRVGGGQLIRVFAKLDVSRDLSRTSKGAVGVEPEKH